MLNFKEFLQEMKTVKDLGDSKNVLADILAKIRTEQASVSKDIEKLIQSADKLVQSGKEDAPLSPNGSLRKKLKILTDKSEELSKQQSDSLDAYKTAN